MAAVAHPDPDVIVVGAGSTGAAVAGRLVERGLSVLVLEAGPDWRSEDLSLQLRIPRPDVFAWRVGGGVAGTPEHVWSGLEAQRWSDSAPERYIRGRGLGGTSTVNGLVAIRPPLEEFAEWERIAGPGWGPAAVLAGFRRLEHDLDYPDEEYHGALGPTPIVRRDETVWGAGDVLLAEGALAAGLPWSPDHNAPGAFGVSRTAMNMRMGVRVTSNDSYLEPLRSRPALRIVADALVDRVLVENGVAVGVRVLHGPDAVNYRAARVVLSAGSAMSPAILQRSGIGPADVLRDLDIPIVADLPVGTDMQDHLGLWIAADVPGGAAAGNGSRGNVTVRYSSGTPGFGEGDILLVGANPLPEEPGLAAIGVKLAHTHSRGRVAIRSRDPRENPFIGMALLSDPRDRELARRAVRDAVGFLRMPAVAGRVAALADKHGAPIDADRDDDDLDGWLRTVATDTAHLSGGASLGRVVGPDLGVLGVPGLSVADLSICPAVVRANTHLTAIMIGELAADLLAPEELAG